MEFYKDLKKDKKKNKRMSIRFQDKNSRLFFHDQQMAYINDK